MYYIFSLLNNIYIKSFVAFLIGILSFIVGDISASVVAVFAIYVLDTMLGLCISLYRGTYDKSRGVYGCVKFILYAVALGAGNLLDIVITDMIQYIHGINILMVKYWIVLYIGCHEGISLLNKLKSIGVPLPGNIFAKIEELKKKMENI